MAYFLLRVVVNALAAAIVMNIVPGLQLAPYNYYGEPLPKVFSYILIGLIFGVMHAFVRPAILFLTGRLYIWSMGLLALATDTFIFLLLSYLAPTIWEVGGTRLFSAIFGAMLMGLIVMTLEALTGLDSPYVMDERRSPFYWRWLGMLPTGRRNRIVENLRTQQIISIIRRYVVDILVGISPMGGVRRSFQRLIYRRRQVLIDQPPAAKVRLMLQELGPTFVKFGQMVASRSEILPADWQAELEKLQDDVAPFPYREVKEIIRRELGKPPEEVFAVFEAEPLAAASTAQVHAATLQTGERVVVKVQRPNIEVTVKGDLNVMQDILDLVERRVSWSRQFGMSPLFREFAENAVTELDFGNEAYNARLLRYNMRNLAFVHVPLIYGAYSTTRVLTQERVDGVKITDIATLDAPGLDREQLAINFFRALLQQVLIDGFFHADPHPGNVWVNPATGRIIFLDMGLMGYLALEDRFALGELIWALQDHDAQSVTRVLVAICMPSKGYNPKALERDIERLVNRSLLFEEFPASLTSMMKDLIDVLLRHGLQVRKEFTLAIKAIGQGESIMRTLLGDQPIDYILNVSYTQLKGLLREQLTLDNVLSHAGKPLAREFLGRLPALQSATMALLDEFQRGHLAFQVTTDSIDQRMRVFSAALDLGIRRVVLSVLLVGLLLGSTLTLLIPLEGKVNEVEGRLIRLVAETGFVISAVLITIILLYTLWQSFRKPDSA